MIEFPIASTALVRCRWLIVLVILAFYCRHFWPVGEGVQLYMRAARCMLDGLPLQQCDKLFTYPPVVAFIMLPLVAVPSVLLNVIWYSFTVAAIAACFRISAVLTQRLIPGPWTYSDTQWLYVIAVIASLEFLFGALGNQSYDAVVVFFVLCGIYALSSQQPAWAGAALGIAAALKATPLLFLPYLLFTRRFTAAAVMAAVVVLLSFLPDLVFTQSFWGEHSYFASWLAGVGGPALAEKMTAAPHVFWSAGGSGNASLRGLVGMFKRDANLTFALILYSVLAVYAALVTAIVVRSYRQSWAVTTDGALLLVSMLLMSPLTSTSHLVALIPSYIISGAVWMKDVLGMRRMAGGLLAVILAVEVSRSQDLVGRTVKTWSDDHRFAVFTMLAIVIFFAIFGNRRMRKEAENAAGQAG